ncbi:MAG TPA: T9SS type A sorting domain-containing protein, partial [Bacteroidia bacterium]|nr:T9SS type A sorting domain-containing protein [Bacteroidia bacterium]
GAGTWNVVYTYTDVNGCSNSATQQITVDLCLGLSNGIINSDVEVFPNPFSNSVTVATDNPQAKADLKIYNLLGEEVYSSVITNQKTEIDLQSLQSGIYFIRITSGDRTITKKIVKQ